MKTIRLFLSAVMLMCLSILGVYAEQETMNLSAGAFANNEITWKGEVCTINQRNDGGTAQVGQNYIAQPRWYGSHVISFSAAQGYTLTGATIECGSTSYASALASGTYTDGAMAKDSGALVMITCNGDFSVKLSAQARVTSITMYYTAGSGTAGGTTTGGTTTDGETTGGGTTNDSTGTGTNQGNTQTGDYLFYESFNQNVSTGGNDGQWSGSIATATVLADNSEWGLAAANGANGCIKLGSSKAKGSAETPTIYCTTGKAMLSFRAGAWAGDATMITVSTSTGFSQQVEILSGAFGEYQIELDGVMGGFTVRFEGNGSSKARFFLDEVLVREVTAGSGNQGTTSGTTTDTEPVTRPSGWYEVSVDVSTFPIDTYKLYFRAEAKDSSSQMLADTSNPNIYHYYVSPGSGIKLSWGLTEESPLYIFMMQDDQTGWIRSQNMQPSLDSEGWTYFTPKDKDIHVTITWTEFENWHKLLVDLSQIQKQVGFFDIMVSEQTTASDQSYQNASRGTNFVCYVRPGRTVNLSTMSNLENQLVYFQEVDGTYSDLVLSTDEATEFTPQSNMNLVATLRAPSDSTNTQPSDGRPEGTEGWYKVTVPAYETLSFGAEQVYDESDPNGYGTGIRKVEQADGGLEVYVRPGASFYLYINARYSADGMPIVEYNYDHMVYFGSTDANYSGLSEHFGNTLTIAPTADMTLYVDKVVAPSTPAAAKFFRYDVQENDGYSIYLETSDTTIAYERTNTTSIWGQTFVDRYFYVKEGEFAKVRCYVNDTANYRFGRWFSSHMSINGDTLNPTYIYGNVSNGDTSSVYSLGVELAKKEIVKPEPAAKYYCYEVLENENYGISLLEPDTTIAYERTRRIDGWTERYFYVKEGERAKIACVVYDSINYRFDHWTSSHSSLNGDTLNPTYIYGNPSYGDTVSGFNLRVQIAKKEIVKPEPAAKYYCYEVLENENYGISLLESDTTIAYERTRRIDGWTERYFYVKEGERAKIACSVYDSINYRFDHWTSSHSSLNGDTLNPTYIYGSLSYGDTVSGFNLRVQIAKKEIVKPEPAVKYYCYSLLDSYDYTIELLTTDTTIAYERVRTIDGWTDRYFYVKEGETAQVRCVVYDSINYRFVNWSSSHMSVNGDTLNPTYIYGNVSYGDTSSVYYLGAELDVVQKEYWKVTLGNIDNIYGYYSFDGNSDDYYEDYEYVGDPTSTAGVETRVLYVVKGASVSVSVGAEKQGYVFDHWTSSFTRYNGNTSNPITISPSSDMTLDPVFSMSYWRVLTQVRNYDEPSANEKAEVNIDVDYDLVSDSADYFMDYDYVDNTSYQYLYIRKGTEVPVTFYNRFPYMVLDHWVSNDTAYNGKTSDPLMLKPTQDMTLGVVLTKGYWQVELPRANENDLTTMVSYYDPEVYNKDDDNMRDDSTTYSQSTHALATPARVYRKDMREEFGDVFMFSEWVATDPTGAGHEVMSIYVRKGATATFFAPYLFVANDYRFDHWISSDAAVNGTTKHPLVYAPTADMTLDFALAQAGAITVVGNDTIAYSDTISAVINLSADGSVTLTIDHVDGSAEITLDSATIAGAGLSSELNSLVIAVENNSTILSDGVGIKFDGGEITVESDDETLLVVKAPAPLVGNGMNSLYIDAAIILTSQPQGDDALQPAISGFANVTIAEGLSVQEVWYGLTKGDPTECVFSELFGAFGKWVDDPAPAPSRSVMYGEINPDGWHVDTQSFVPATSICIASPAFYVDYIDGKIEIATGLNMIEMSENGLNEKPSDMRCFDILGRQIDGPQKGLYIQNGKVYLGL